MEPVWVDACIFIEIALDQRRAEECAELIKEIREGKVKAFTSDYCVYSTILVTLAKGAGSKAVEGALNAFHSLKGLEIVRPNLEVMHEALSISAKRRLDFDDSLVLSCMRRLGINTIATLDRDFEKTGVEFAVAPK